MKLGEKLIHLREIEGQVRGLPRPLTKAEVARFMRAEIGHGVSHAYLSQLESGARAHLSAQSRDHLAKFFKVHPGYLVNDPPGFETQLASTYLLEGPDLRSWLANRADEQRGDPIVFRALLRLSRQDDPRRYLALLDDLLDQPIERLEAALRTIDSTRMGSSDLIETVQRAVEEEVAIS